MIWLLRTLGMNSADAYNIGLPVDVISTIVLICIIDYVISIYQYLNKYQQQSGIK